jgi:hypothetical protein
MACATSRGATNDRGAGAGPKAGAPALIQRRSSWSSSGPGRSATSAGGISLLTMRSYRRDWAGSPGTIFWRATS